MVVFKNDIFFLKDRFLQSKNEEVVFLVLVCGFVKDLNFFRFSFLTIVNDLLWQPFMFLDKIHFLVGNPLYPKKVMENIPDTIVFIND